MHACMVPLIVVQCSRHAMVPLTLVQCSRHTRGAVQHACKVPLTVVQCSHAAGASATYPLQNLQDTGPGQYKTLRSAFY